MNMVSTNKLVRRCQSLGKYGLALAVYEFALAIQRQEEILGGSNERR